MGKLIYCFTCNEEFEPKEVIDGRCPTCGDRLDTLDAEEEEENE